MLINQKPIVFTDLDGTLLDHKDYSCAAAQEMLDKLTESNIPIVPNTSKTRTEVLQLRSVLSLNGPFIVENGAAVYIPFHFLPDQPADAESVGDYWCKSFAPPRQLWIDLLEQTKGEFGSLFRHFATMTNQQVVDATGLKPDAARLAMIRDFGEPIEWLGNKQQKAKFISALKKLGANPVEGGRFIHLKGDTDKGLAMNWLVEQFTQQLPQFNWVSIALGDGQNDAAMLEKADYPIRILSPVNPPPTLNTENPVITSSLTGPAGWTETLQKLLYTE